MARKEGSSVWAIDLFNLSFLRGWNNRRFFRRLRSERGNLARRLFYHDMYEALRLRIPMDEALAGMAAEYSDPVLPTYFSEKIFSIRETAENMERRIALHLMPLVAQGMRLSEAMQRMGDAFSKQERSIVAMGETLGMLPEALKRLGDYSQIDLRIEKLFGAFMYPVKLLLFCAAVISFILIKIIPKYTDIFDQLGGGLPGPTQWLVEASYHMTRPQLGMLVIVGAVMLLYLVVHSVPMDEHRSFTARLLSLTGLLREVSYSRWLAALTLNLEAGVPADVALRMAGGTVGGRLGGRSHAAAKLVEQGASIGEACIRCKVLDRWMNHRLQLIDWHGNFLEWARGLAEDAERRATERLDRLAQRVEVFSVLGIGLVVGLVVICIYLPLFKIPNLIKY